MFGGLSLSPGGGNLPAEIAHIGRDPFDPDFGVAEVATRLRRKRTGVKRAPAGSAADLRYRQYLRRRGVVAGAHALRSSDWDPAAARARELLQAAAEVMREAFGQGGTSFDALYVNVNGSSGYFDRALAVYGQERPPLPSGVARPSSASPS